jgi:hypothetical protein
MGGLMECGGKKKKFEFIHSRYLVMMRLSLNLKNCWRNILREFSKS